MATNFTFDKFSLSQLDMLHETSNLAHKNQSTTDLVPDFKNTIIVIDDKLESLDGLIAPQSGNNTGISLDKQSLKTILADVAFGIANPVAGWAASQNNQALEKKLGLALTSIRKMRDQRISSFAQDIIDTVTPLLPQIVSTGITQQTLDSLASANTAFQSVVTAPRNSKVIRKQMTETMVSILADAMAIARRSLDRYASLYKTINNEFFLQYRAARKLQPYGNTHTRADVTVTMGDSNSPLPNALVQIEGTQLKAITDKDGRCTLSPTPIGERKLIVTAAGFTNPVVTPAYTFKRGKATKITVEMTNFDIPASTTVKSKQTVNS